VRGTCSKVWRLGFRIWGLIPQGQLRVKGFEGWILGYGVRDFLVWGLGFAGLEFGVCGLGLEA
jgi:hypothetical protein